jgi:hypothetical protein
MHILKPIENMVLKTGIALYSFKFLEMLGMYLFLIEIVATYIALRNRNKFRKKKQLRLAALFIAYCLLVECWILAGIKILRK